MPFSKAIESLTELAQLIHQNSELGPLTVSDRNSERFTSQITDHIFQYGSTSKNVSPNDPLLHSLTRLLNTHLLEFRSRVSTNDVTPLRDEQESIAATMLEKKEMDLVEYEEFLNSLSHMEFPLYDVLVTTWSAIVDWHGGELIVLEKLLEYGDINNYLETNKRRQARLKFGMMFPSLSLTQYYHDPRTPEGRVELQSCSYRIEVPYQWQDSKDPYMKGAGKIEIEFDEVTGAVQVHFKKGINGNNPVIAASYAVNVTTENPQGLDPENWSSQFDAPFQAEGIGIPLSFEQMEDFLLELIEEVATIAVESIRTAMAVLLVKSEL